MAVHSDATDSGAIDESINFNDLNDLHRKTLTILTYWQPDPYNASEVRFYDSLYNVERGLSHALTLFERGL